MYNTIIFDLDDTLSNDRENIKGAFKEVLKYRNEIYTEEKFNKFLENDRKFWSQRACGIIKDPYEFKTNDEKAQWLRAERFVRYFKDLDHENAITINNLYMKALRDTVVPIEGQYEIIKYLHDKKYKILIATNGPKVAVIPKLQKLGIYEYIDDILCAEDTGYMKPHKEFFNGLFLKINKNDRPLLVGDELDKDIKGGNENGIDTCWFHSREEEIKQESKPTYIIKELKELKNML